MKVIYTLMSTSKQDQEQIERYGPMVPTPYHYGTITIDGAKEVCEAVKKLLESSYRLE